MAVVYFLRCPGSISCTSWTNTGSWWRVHVLRFHPSTCLDPRFKFQPMYAVRSTVLGDTMASPLSSLRNCKFAKFSSYYVRIFFLFHLMNIQCFFSQTIPSWSVQTARTRCAFRSTTWKPDSSAGPASLEPAGVFRRSSKELPVVRRQARLCCLSSETAENHRRKLSKQTTTSTSTAVTRRAAISS